MFKIQQSSIKNYKIAFDNIKTLEDVIGVLKALNVTFNVDINNLTPNIKEAINNGVIIPESVDKSQLN
jgi:hypothetical protein